MHDVATRHLLRDLTQDRLQPSLGDYCHDATIAYNAIWNMRVRIRFNLPFTLATISDPDTPDPLHPVDQLPGLPLLASLSLCFEVELSRR